MASFTIWKYLHRSAVVGLLYGLLAYCALREQEGHATVTCSLVEGSLNCAKLFFSSLRYVVPVGPKTPTATAIRKKIISEKVSADRLRRRWRMSAGKVLSI